MASNPGFPGYVTHQGPRKSNQDSLKMPFTPVLPANTGQVVPPEYFQRAGALYLLADGMGGYQGGETASRIALEAMERTYYNNTQGEPTARLRESVFMAHHAIREAASRDPNLESMGTTLVGALLLPGGQTHVFNVGDSPAWVVPGAGGPAQEISADHSLVGRQVAAGTLTKEQARASRNKNVLTMALGMQEPLEPYISQPLGARPGDVLVLMSDGTSNMMVEQEVADIVRRAGMNYQRAAEELAALALERKTTDNCSVVVIPLATQQAAYPVGAVAAGGAAVAATQTGGSSDQTMEIRAAPLPVPVQGARSFPILPLAVVLIAVLITGALFALNAAGNNNGTATANNTTGGGGDVVATSVPNIGEGEEPIAVAPPLTATVVGEQTLPTIEGVVVPVITAGPSPTTAFDVNGNVILPTATPALGVQTTGGDAVGATAIAQLTQSANATANANIQATARIVGGTQTVVAANAQATRAASQTEVAAQATVRAPANLAL